MSGTTSYVFLYNKSLLLASYKKITKHIEKLMEYLKDNKKKNNKIYEISLNINNTEKCCQNIFVGIWISVFEWLFTVFRNFYGL